MIIEIFAILIWGRISKGQLPLQTKALACDEHQVLHAADINSLCSQINNSSFKSLGEKEVTILQEDQIGVISGFKCRKFESRFNYHCGMYSHLSLDGLHEIRRPVDVPAAQCMEALFDRKLTTEAGAVIMLPKHKNVRIAYNFLRKGDLIHNTHSVSCEGSMTKVGQQEITEGLELVDVEFSIMETDFEIGFNSIKDCLTANICRQIAALFLNVSTLIKN